MLVVFNEKRKNKRKHGSNKEEIYPVPQKGAVHRQETLIVQTTGDETRKEIGSSPGSRVHLPVQESATINPTDSPLELVLDIPKSA